MNIQRPHRDIHQIIVEECDRHREFAVATVLKAEGSTPCKAGGKAIIDAGGAIQGTIGGGAVEARAQGLGVEAIQTGRPLVFDFDLEGNTISNENPICGGMMRVLIDPTAASHRAVYAAASEARQRRERGLLLTTIRGAKEPAVEVRFLTEREIPSAVGFPHARNIRSALGREETELFVRETSPEGQRLAVLVEPIIPRPLLLIIGGGHIGQALAQQADLVGFDLLVIDDRKEFTAVELFPDGATTRCGQIDVEIDRLSIGGDTYIVIVTRGHRHDATALAACLDKPAAYLGMIGSRRKVSLMRKEFIESGRTTAAEFNRVYAPIGLDIGAVTVPEIASSITAQLIAVRRKGASPRIPGI
jgi:xanthine dehydrogenase accessory factor